MKRLITICLMAVLFGTGSVMAAYSGGTGDPNSPYLISTVADWQELMAAPGDWDKSFLLTADIDLTGVSLTPVGSRYDDMLFAGVFDGNGHIIRNVVINMPSYTDVGLFGGVSSGGKIKNLGVEDANITGDFTVGGLVGKNMGSVTACYATGSVTGDTEVGGLMGGNGGSVTSCYATGAVTGTAGVGIIVGGIVGGNGGSVTSCYATGSVNGFAEVGGLVGVNSGSVTFCYATGSVSGTWDYVGGLVGQSERSGSVTAGFWDMNTSGQTTSAGGTGETTSQMKTLSTFTSAGWDFVETWGIGENQTYPYLRTASAADLNNDGKVDFEDFAIFAQHWLEGVNP